MCVCVCVSLHLYLHLYLYNADRRTDRPTDLHTYVHAHIRLARPQPFAIHAFRCPRSSPSNPEPYQIIAQRVRECFARMVSLVSDGSTDLRRASHQAIGPRTCITRMRRLHRSGQMPGHLHVHLFQPSLAQVRQAIRGDASRDTAAERRVSPPLP